MMTTSFEQQPHRRLNPLTGEWVLVSPHRAARPWQGQVEPVAGEHLPAHDATCYLCPGNARAGGHRNPDYAGTYVFDHDYPALVTGTPDVRHDAAGGLVVAESVPGICRVVCFSPRHDLTLSQMTHEGVRGVIDTWCAQTSELSAHHDIRYVQVFENRGAMMGCSNPHPHGQIWASGDVPNEPAKELATQRAYFSAHGRTMLGDYLAYERTAGERLVVENEHCVALVPFWAVWPFETLLVATHPVADLPSLSGDARDGWADVLRRLTRAYDRLFDVSFPYSLGIHQAPCDDDPHPEWHLHAHVYPPLLRSATVRKFMVGYELLASPQRDLTPESAAERLRERESRDTGAP